MGYHASEGLNVGPARYVGIDQLKQRERPLRMHQDSSQVAAYFAPNEGFREQLARKTGKAATDHTRNNRTAIKEISEMNRARRGMEKEIQQLEKAQARFKARPAPQVQDPAALSPVRVAPGGSVQRDFMHENIQDAARALRKTKDKVEADPEAFRKKKDFGRVPLYLQERKIEMAADKAMAAHRKELEDVPPGMRVLGEQERRETLDLLVSDRESVEAQLRRMPFVVETAGLIQRKSALEERLREIDEAMRMFSRPRVLVRAF